MIYAAQIKWIIPTTFCTNFPGKHVRLGKCLPFLCGKLCHCFAVRLHRVSWLETECWPCSPNPSRRFGCIYGGYSAITSSCTVCFQCDPHNFCLLVNCFAWEVIDTCEAKDVRTVISVHVHFRCVPFTFRLLSPRRQFYLYSIKNQAPLCWPSKIGFLYRT